MNDDGARAGFITLLSELKVFHDGVREGFSPPQMIKTWAFFKSFYRAFGCSVFTVGAR